MEEKIINLMDSVNELVNSYLKSIADVDAIANIDESEMQIVKNLINIMNSLGEVLVEYGKNSDEQNKKLERIVELLEKADRMKEIENAHIVY